MGCLREIPRTATFAWSPSNTSHYLATGTKAGAVDEGFSNDTQLELWDLELGNLNKSLDVQPVASISTDSRFNDIAWTINGPNNSRGIIAGALENGSLDLWDSERLLGGQDDTLMSRTTNHSGSIRALQFNAFRSELLATVGAKGELFISDLNNVGNPFRMGNAVARADDFECLDWNKRTSHIMVTGSSGGTMTVWDIKNKRESLTLNNMGRKVVSAVAWDPVKTTRLATAIPHDTEPVILVWDLRNANAPERILRGHDGGVLSLSWCKQDSDLLLSSGKDNRNLCWNPQTGEAYGEFPVVTNWTFQTRWNPHNPNFMATASFDGRIAIRSIQSTKSEADMRHDSQSQPLDDEDFFNKAQSRPQGTTFTLAKAPKWLQRPCGSTFSFGGKIVSFKSSSSELNKHSAVRISTYAIDDTIIPATNSFEASLNKNDLTSICIARIAAATDDADEADWRVIKILTSKDTRKDLIDYLGFSTQDKVNDGILDASVNGEKRDDPKTQNNGEASSKTNRLSAFFDNSADGDNFLSELAATRGVKFNNPFQLYNGFESKPDRKITRSLLLGDFETALDVCLHEHRMSDAFMIATCGGQNCIEKAQEAYFNQMEGSPNYMRLLASIVGRNLWDLVHNADLESWKDVMTSLCTYANAGEFPDLCEALGDRLAEQLQNFDNSNSRRKDAAFCYLAGSKLEKVISIWISELQENEQRNLKHTGEGSAFSIHARSLQSFIEKVTVFRQVTDYHDDQQDAASDWKLTALYERYIEYADIASAHGQLQVAGRYLDLLPARFAAANLAKDRIKNSLQKAAPQSGSRHLVTGNRAPQTTTPGTLNFQQEEQRNRPMKNPPNQTNPYAPVSASITQAQNPYVPANSQYGPSTHAIAGNQQQQQPPPQPGMPFNAQYQNAPSGGPPRNFDASPPIPPPSKASKIGNWNDMPESFFKPPSMSRRGTPTVPVNDGHQLQQSVPSPNQLIGPPQKPMPLVGPPPKANAGPPRFASSPVNVPQSFQHTERPPSTTNSYAPSQPSLPSQSPSTVPRGPSPYNAPPSAPPPSNRYAPSQPGPTKQTELPSMLGNTTQVPPPANPYAPQQNQKLERQGPPPVQQPPPSVGLPQRSAAAPPSVPPQASPQGSRSNTALSQRNGTASKHCECFYHKNAILLTNVLKSSRRSLAYTWLSTANLWNIERRDAADQGTGSSVFQSSGQ